MQFYCDCFFIVTTFFFLHAVLTIVQFLQIARNWKNISIQFVKIDIQMEDYRNSNNFKRNIKVLTFIIMTAAVCKFLLKIDYHS